MKRWLRKQLITYTAASYNYFRGVHILGIDMNFCVCSSVSAADTDLTEQGIL